VKHLWHLYDGSKLLLRQQQQQQQPAPRIHRYRSECIYLAGSPLYTAYIVHTHFFDLGKWKKPSCGHKPPLFVASSHIRLAALSLLISFLVFSSFMYMFFYLYEFELGSCIHARSFYPMTFCIWLTSLRAFEITSPPHPDVCRIEVKNYHQQRKYRNYLKKGE
jgi:hypothetical protein